MKQAVPAPVIAAIIIVIVVLIGYFGYRAVSPPQSQLNHAYTAGTPPWLDPKMKDQSQNGASGGATTTAPAGAGPAAAPGGAAGGR